MQRKSVSTGVAQESSRRGEIPAQMSLLAVLVGFIASVLLVIIPAVESAAANRLGASMDIVLLQSSLDDVSAIVSPTIGLGGAITLAVTDFVTVEGRLGAQFVGTGKVVSFPAAAGSVQNIELDTATIFTFPAQYERIRVPQSFDEISEDGRWLAGMASRNDGVQVIFALDLQNLALGAELPIPELYASSCKPDPVWGEVEPDWVGVSPLGNYLVVQWVRADTTRCSGLETFNVQTGAFAGRVTDNPRHGDLGVDSDGVTEFFMTTELSSPGDPNRPAIAMHQLPGTSAVSPPIYLQVVDWADEDHISCRGPNGVCLVSWGILGDSYDFAFENELFLQYTDGSVLRLVHHRSSKCGYWVQPRASISRDGRYVVFASDWGEQTGTNSCGGGNDMGLGDPYTIDLSASSSPPSVFVYLAVVLR